MPQFFIDVTEEELTKLRETLSLLERLDIAKIETLDIYVYGMTNSPAILDAAREAVADASNDEISEEDVTLSEVAIAIPVSADILYYLTGSGFKLRNESFVYTGEGEGPREVNFAFSNFRPRVTLADFTHFALADSDGYLDRYLSKYGKAGAAVIKKRVQRTEEATQPGVPTPTPTPAAIPAAPPTAKQTSLSGVAVNRLVEDFLG